MCDSRQTLQRLKGFAALRNPARRPGTQIPLAALRRHPSKRLGDSSEQQIDDAVVEQSQQQIELGAVGGARQLRDLAGDARTEVRRGVLHQRCRHHAQDLLRFGRQG